MIPKVESMLKDVLESNDFFLSMICLLQWVSAERLGCPRTNDVPLLGSLCSELFLAVNVFSLCFVMEHVLLIQPFSIC
jgi:hypothetical protein